MTTLPTLTVEDRVTADEASPTWLAESGLTSVRRRRSPQWNAAVLEAFQLYERVLTGNARAALDFVEAMTRSDFPLLFADVIDRQLLGAYQEYQPAWPRVARRGTVRDFRTVKRFTLDGGAAVLGRVRERTEYPEAGLSEGVYSYAVAKYGRILGIDWESLVNDDLDAFRLLPQTLGKAGRLTEDKFATELYAAATGPDPTFFSVANANIVTGNPVLSITALQTAFTVLGSHRDSDGNPIYIESATLVVPPALEVTARNILNAIEILAATGGGTGSGGDQIRTVNWMRNKVELVVNPWLPIVDLISGSTAWYLFASPDAGRPAMEIGFLRGQDTPQLFVKAPDALRVGGGLAPVEDGDFETDSIRHKVRHVLGGTLMDPNMAVASAGDADASS